MKATLIYSIISTGTLYLQTEFGWKGTITWRFHITDFGKSWLIRNCRRKIWLKSWILVLQQLPRWEKVKQSQLMCWNVFAIIWIAILVILWKINFSQANLCLRPNIACWVRMEGYYEFWEWRRIRERLGMKIGRPKFVEEILSQTTDEYFYYPVMLLKPLV